MTEAIFKKMVEERERHGVQGFPEVRGVRSTWRRREHGRPAGARLADAVRAVQRRRRAPRVGARTARAPARRGDVLGTVLTQVGALTWLTKLVDVARHLDAEFVLALGDADPSPLGGCRTRAGGRVGAAVRAAADLRGAGAPRRGRLDADRDRRRSHATRAAARRRPVHERGRRGAARAPAAGRSRIRWTRS